MAFNYRRGRRQELLDKRARVDNGVTPTFIPTDFKNKFVARMKDTNIDPNKELIAGEFSNPEADHFISEKLPTIDNIPNFQDKYSNSIAKGFLDKYQASFVQPPEEKISAESTLKYITGDPNPKGVFPGGMEVS